MPTMLNAVIIIIIIIIIILITIIIFFSSFFNYRYILFCLGGKQGVRQTVCPDSFLYQYK